MSFVRSTARRYSRYKKYATLSLRRNKLCDKASLTIGRSDTIWSPFAFVPRVSLIGCGERDPLSTPCATLYPFSSCPHLGYTPCSGPYSSYGTHRCGVPLH